MKVIKIREYDIKKIEFFKYTYNNNTAVRLICSDNSPYGTISVNFPENIPNGFIYLDINNYKYSVDLEKIFKTYNFGTFTGLYKESGYCKYPLYQLNLKQIEKYNSFMQKKEYFY